MYTLCINYLNMYCESLVYLNCSIYYDVKDYVPFETADLYIYTMLCAM